LIGDRQGFGQRNPDRGELLVQTEGFGRDARGTVAVTGSAITVEAVPGMAFGTGGQSTNSATREARWSMSKGLGRNIVYGGICTGVTALIRMTGTATSG
jgi:hypothetical protein